MEIKIMNDALIKLLSENESEWIDFKKEFHKNNAELLHDILCLCNAHYNGERYLVFGIANDKSIHGIQDDINKKTNADLNDFLRQVQLNRIPKVDLFYVNYEESELAFLQIQNSKQKPFYLRKDRREGKIIVRAGVIYTRLGDTNIPRSETAPDEHIERMWMERFGLQRLQTKSIEKDFPIKLDDSVEKVINTLGEPDATGWQIAHYYSEGIEISFDQHTDLVDGLSVSPLPSGTAFDGTIFGVKLGDKFSKVKEQLGKPNYWGLANENSSMAVWNVEDKLLVIRIWSNRNRDDSIPSQQLGTVKSISYCNEKSQIGYNVLVAQAIDQLQRGEIPKEFEHGDEITLIDVKLDDEIFNETYELLGARPHSFGGAEILVAFLETETVLAFWVYPVQWQFPKIRAISKLQKTNEEK